VSTENDLKLIHQILTARKVPVALESFENDDSSSLFNDLVAIRKALIQFSRGNFDCKVTGLNVFAGALRILQANLHHLAWQVGEVAKGDFLQRVDVMGELSKSFNAMVEQLERSLINLKASEERWNLAVQCSRDGIVDINIDERSAWYSDSFMQMLYYSPEDLPKNLRWETMIHPDDHIHAKMLTTILQGEREPIPFSRECRLRTGRGNYLWVRLRGMPVSGKVRRLIGVVSDISAQKEMEETLIHLAMYDNLTGLPNRHLLNDRLQQAVAKSERSGQAFLFMTMDIDFFKRVNDTYGHAAGDLVLVELARQLSIGLRHMDTAARIGGDEFVAIVLCEKGQEQTTATHVMERFYENLHVPVMLGKEEYRIRSSVGIAFFPKHAQDVATLFEHADAALYRAKENGKNQFVIYDPNDPEINRFGNQ